MNLLARRISGPRSQPHRRLLLGIAISLGSCALIAALYVNFPAFSPGTAVSDTLSPPDGQSQHHVRF